jgi:hypothetical protein
MRTAISQRWFRWLASLVATIGLLPGLLGVATVALYVFPERVPLSFLRDYAIPLGSILGVLGWLLIGLLSMPFASLRYASAMSHAEIEARHTVDKKRLEALSPVPNSDPAAVNEAEACLQRVQDALTGPHDRNTWASGSGYVALWTYLHRAEEAMLRIVPAEMIPAECNYERLRLEGSRMPGRDSLEKLVNRAASFAAWSNERPPEPAGLSAARPIVVLVRRVVNEYRDDLSAGLVRLRARVVRLQLLMGMTAYVVVILAILQQVEAKYVVSFAAFYLIGAITGLAQAAYAESHAEPAVEDYGLSKARLLLSPLLSGVAAVGGVLLVALLSGHPLGLDLLGQTAQAKESVLVNLTIARYPGAIVVAAIFGLSPELLLRRIRSLGDELQLAIKASEPTGG